MIPSFEWKTGLKTRLRVLEWKFGLSKRKGWGHCFARQDIMGMVKINSNGGKFARCDIVGRKLLLVKGTC
jgi:hypothetical protein